MDSIVALNIGYQKALLIRPIQVPDIPQPVECRGGVAEDVAGGGEAFGLGGVDHGHVFGDDLLGVVVEFQAHFVVEFLAGLDVEVVDQSFPLGGGFRLVGVPEVQGLAAMPDGDAAVRVRAAGQADDDGLPVIGSGKPGRQARRTQRTRSWH